MRHAREQDLRGMRTRIRAFARTAYPMGPGEVLLSGVCRRSPNPSRPQSLSDVQRDVPTGQREGEVLQPELRGSGSWNPKRCVRAVAGSASLRGARVLGVWFERPDRAASSRWESAQQRSLEHRHAVPAAPCRGTSSGLGVRPPTEVGRRPPEGKSASAGSRDRQGPRSRCPASSRSAALRDRGAAWCSSDLRLPLAEEVRLRPGLIRVSVTEVGR